MSRARPNEAPPFLLLALMDIAALRDEHTIHAGFYFGATTEDESKNWRGFSLYESSDPDAGFVKMGDFPLRCRMGRVTVPPLSSSIVDHRYTDRASVLRVEMMNPNDELSSISENEMRAGRNRFLLGKEIIGAATCVLVSTDPFSGRKTYDLSVLNRGIKDTFPEMDTHVEGEALVWLDGPGIYFFRQSIARNDEPRYYKAVHGGGTLVEAFPFLLASSSASLRPFRPLGIKGTRDGSNNLTVTWDRQTRRAAQFLNQGTPLVEENERYRIRVYPAPNSNAIQRDEIVIIATGAARTWSYSAANQSTDGLTPGDPVTLEITQLSAAVVDGNVSRATI